MISSCHFTCIGTFDPIHSNSFQKLGIKLHKYDELLCLTRGIEYLNSHFPNECIYFANSNSSGFGATKQVFDFQHPIYPYIITNIGSGVSILLVRSQKDITRIGGTSVGGGTFQGLCALLNGIDSFDKSLAMAERGDSTKVDKLVRDIYGGDYEKFGLSGDLVASRWVSIGTVLLRCVATECVCLHV